MPEPALAGPLRLLCIEDDPADWLLIKRHLKKHGLITACRRVDTYAELDAALGEEWDAVLSDYHVPGMDFRATLHRMQARSPELPVILVSGTIGEEAAVELLKRGAWDFILKDNLTRLAPAIQRCLDIVEDRRVRREAERALKANEAKLRAYFEHAPILLLVVDGQGKLVDANPMAMHTLGYDLPSLLGLRLVDVAAEEDRARAAADFARLGETEKGETGHVEGEYRLRRRDGGLVWVALSAARIAADRFIANAVDISARKQAEEHLRLMAAVFNATQEGVAVTDLEGRVLAVNAAFTTITEYPAAEVMGQRLNMLASGRQEPVFYQNMWRDLREVGYWQGEIWDRRKGGDIYPQWLTIGTVADSAGAPEKYVGVFTDISRIKHATTHLEYLAHHDALTDLPNRLLLMSRLEHALTLARRSGVHGALLFLDLDRFKAVNDLYGHHAGDDLLKQAATRMHSRLRDIDTLARLGGDEFVVVIEEARTPEVAAHMAREIIGLLNQPFDLACGERVEIGCSIGICLFPLDGESVAALLDHADAALYQAKRDGRNNFRFHQPGKGG